MKKKLAVLVIFVVILWLTYPFFLNGLANFLICRDRLEKADAIVVLAGDNNGERVDEGVKLFRKRYAKKMVMSGGPIAWRLTYAVWMRKQALWEGVPLQAIFLENKSESTLDNALFTLPILKENKCQSIILVTSPAHSRRAAYIFRRIYRKDGIKVISWPVEKSIFNPHDWWKRYEDRACVAHEYIAFPIYLLKGMKY